MQRVGQATIQAGTHGSKLVPRAQQRMLASGVKSLKAPLGGLTRPATGRMRNPVVPCSTWLRSSSWGTASGRRSNSGQLRWNCGGGTRVWRGARWQARGLSRGALLAQGAASVEAVCKRDRLCIHKLSQSCLPSLPPCRPCPPPCRHAAETGAPAASGPTPKLQPLRLCKKCAVWVPRCSGSEVKGRVGCSRSGTAMRA